MIPPPICYSWPFPKDVSTQQLEIVWRQPTMTSDGFGLFPDTVVYTVPGDRVLLLTHLAAVYYPPGGTNARVDFWHCSGTSSITSDAIPMLDLGGGGVARYLPWNGELWIPPGRTVWMNGSYGAAAAGTFLGALHGILIPRGNVANA